MTPEMVARARRNAATGGFDHVEIREGLIEELPLPDSSMDVVISNGVLNLSTRKSRVLAETMRVLRPGWPRVDHGSRVDGGATGRRAQESGGARRLTGGDTGGASAAEEVLQRRDSRRSRSSSDGGSGWRICRAIRCSRRSSWNSCVRRCLRIATTSWCRRSPSRPASRPCLTDVRRLAPQR